MKKDLILIGKTYHNGKTGRSYSSRQVLEMNLPIDHSTYPPVHSETGVRFLQIKGAYSGKEFTYPLESFAKWAKGEVLPKANEPTK